jgi:transposase
VEATGQYWKPVWQVLEERGVALMLVNAHHVKILPGRKTDVADPAWLAELLEHGLLRGSFVPPVAIRELRDLTRYRKRLIQVHTAECQRVQKTLEDAGIKLDSVAADVLGVSGRAMLAALVAGEGDPKVLAELARGRLRNELPQLRQALRGRFRGHHALLVRLALGTWSSWRGRSPSSTRLSTGCWPRSLGPGPSWTPSPGWASGPPRRSSPRSAPT